jgi:hypothetical protein
VTVDGWDGGASVSRAQVLVTRRWPFLPSLSFVIPAQAGIQGPEGECRTE